MELECVRCPVSACKSCDCRDLAGADADHDFSPAWLYTPKPRTFCSDHQTPLVIPAADRHELLRDMRDILLRRSPYVYNDRICDMYLTDATGRVTHVFELLTDQTSTALYVAITHLMLVTVPIPNPVRKTIVVLRTPEPEVVRRSQALGVSIIVYGKRSFADRLLGTLEPLASVADAR